MGNFIPSSQPRMQGHGGFGGGSGETRAKPYRGGEKDCKGGWCLPLVKNITDRGEEKKHRKNVYSGWIDTVGRITVSSSPLARG